MADSSSLPASTEMTTKRKDSFSDEEKSLFTKSDSATRGEEGRSDTMSDQELVDVASSPFNYMNSVDRLATPETMEEALTLLEKYRTHIDEYHKKIEELSEHTNVTSPDPSYPSMSDPQSKEYYYLHTSIFKITGRRMLAILPLFIILSFTQSVVHHYEYILELWHVVDKFLICMIGTLGIMSSQVITSVTSMSRVSFRTLFCRELCIGFLMSVSIAAIMYIRVIVSYPDYVTSAGVSAFGMFFNTNVTCLIGVLLVRGTQQTRFRNFLDFILGVGSVSADLYSLVNIVWTLIMFVQLFGSSEEALPDNQGDL